MKVFPAGLLDQNIEIFGNDFKANCLHDGQRKEFDEFPLELIEDLQEKFDNHPTAKAGYTKWGVEESEQLEHFTFCNFAGFDEVPDFDPEKGLGAYEYHNHCGRRGLCDFEGKCCSGLVVENGKLTPREIQVTALIGKCYSDKLICFELEISQDTLRNHKNSIERKTGVFGKVGIAIIAHKHKLI